MTIWMHALGKCCISQKIRCFFRFAYAEGRAACRLVCLPQGDRADHRHAGLVAAVLQQVVLPLALAYGILLAIVANGRRLVNRPQLCPRLAHPWQHDGAVELGGAMKH